MASYDIPMSSGPTGAAAGLQTQIPLDPRGSQIPLEVKPFAPIDLNKATEAAYKTASDIGEYEEQQSRNLEAQETRETKQRDMAILQSYTAAGNKLYSHDDLELAKKDLASKLSPEGLQNLQKRSDDAESNQLKFNELATKSGPEALAAQREAGNFAIDQMQNAMDANKEALAKNPNDVPGAQAAFMATKAASIQSMRGQVNPATGNPMFPQQMLDTLEQATDPDTVKNIMASTEHGVALAAAAEARLWRESQVEANKATAAEKKENVLDKTQKRSGLAGQIQQIDASTLSDEDKKRAKEKLLYTPADKSKGNAMMSPDQIGYWAERVRAEGTNILTRVDALDRAAIMGQVYEQSKASGSTASTDALRHEYVKAGQSALTKLVTQQQLVGAFSKTASLQLDQLQKLSKGVTESDIPLLNEALLSGAKHITGSPAANAYLSTLISTQGELAKILSGSTGGAGSTDQSRREAAEMLNKYVTPGQLEVLVPNLKQELSNRGQGYKDQQTELMDKMKLAELPSKPSAGASPDVAEANAQAKAAREGPGRAATLKGELADAKKTLTDSQAALAAAKTPNEKKAAQTVIDETNKQVTALNKEITREGGTPAAKPKVIPPTKAEHDEALAWAKANPNDPMAKKILEYHDAL